MPASPAASTASWYPELIARNDQPTPVAIEPSKDVAVQQYTGGTTGLPQAAPC